MTLLSEVSGGMKRIISVMSNAFQLWPDPAEFNKGYEMIRSIRNLEKLKSFAKT